MRGGRPSFRLLQEVAWKDGSRIAVIHCRFYDFAGWKATLFPKPAKSRSAAVSRVEKAWLTFSGYQSLISIEAEPRWRTAFKKKRPVESG
jgi:hypothetical protein